MCFALLNLKDNTIQYNTIQYNTTQFDATYDTYPVFWSVLFSSECRHRKYNLFFSKSKWLLSMHIFLYILCVSQRNFIFILNQNCLILVRYFYQLFFIWFWYWFPQIIIICLRLKPNEGSWCNALWTSHCKARIDHNFNENATFIELSFFSSVSDFWTLTMPNKNISSVGDRWREYRISNRCLLSTEQLKCYRFKRIYFIYLFCSC